MKSAISQYNYEEFFLLYVDNELSAADKQAVEQFVQANPYLAIELEMLQQMQLPSEQLVFDKKGSLYRSEIEAINLATHEEQFLLYVDNELSAEDKHKVETFVLQHPAVQESFTSLKQVKLEPELVVFHNKHSLYRKEKKERRIFYLSWQRMAIAAALIGLVVIVWTVLPTDKTTQQNIALNTATPAKNTATDGLKVPTGNNNGTKLITGEIPSINRSANGVAKVTTNIANQVPADNMAGSTNPVLVKNEMPVRINETQKEEIIESPPQKRFETTGGSTLKISGDNPSADNADVFRAAMMPEGNNAVANNTLQPAVYKELDTEDEKKSLLLGSLEINKDKLRGFFRKAGSLFRSKAKTEDDKTEGRASSPNIRSSK